MTRAAVVASVFLLAALAGCIGDDVDPNGPDPTAPTVRGDDDEERLKSAERTRLERELGALEIVAARDPDWSRPNVTKDDWLLLSVDATPAGQVVAYRWEVPHDALVKTIDGEGERLVLDFTLTLGPMGAPAGLPPESDWLFLTLWERYDDAASIYKAARIGMMQGLTQTVSVKSGLGSGGGTTTVPPRDASFSQIVQYDGLAPGDTLYFVLAARSPTLDSFGLGMRILGQEFAGQQQGDSPTTGWDDFQRVVGERVPYAPERTGTGENLYMALYVSDTRIVERTITTTSADMDEPEEDLPDDLFPYWTARISKLHSATPWGGWSYAIGGYASIGEFGRWQVTADMHGTDCSGAVPFLTYEPLVPESLHVDSDPIIFVADLEGEGSSEIEVEITKTGTLFLESLAFAHYSIGASITDLVGMPYWTSCRA